MNKQVYAAIKKVYSECYENIVSDLRIRSGNDYEDILHDGILNYIEDTNKWGSYRDLTESELLDICYKICNDYKTKLFISSHIRIVAEDPMNVLVDNEDREKIIECINSLKPIYTTVLISKIIDKMTIKEISAFYNLKADTVSKRIRRGRAQLLKMLIRKGYRVN